MTRTDRPARPGEHVVSCPDFRHVAASLEAARAWRGRTEVNCSWSHQIHDHEGVLVSE